MVIAIALFTAFLRALSAVIQRRAAGKPDAKELFHHSFIRSLLKSKWWLFGLSIQVIAVATNAIALYFGPLILVESLLTVDIVFVMLILHFYYKVPAGFKEWGGVFAVCFGLSAVLLAARPHGGHAATIGTKWVVVGIVITSIIVVCALLMRRSSSPKLRAAMGGIASGCNFALSAGLVKLVFFQWESGIGNVFTSWEVYALFVSLIASVVVLQSTYGGGPLAISQPVIEIVRPFARAVIGILLFEEIVNINAFGIVAASIGACVAAAGVIMLSRSKHILNSPA